jgi:hypothetical protein
LKYPIYNTENPYPAAACFRLSKSRLCLITEDAILVQDAYRKQEKEVLELIKEVESEEPWKPD